MASVKKLQKSEQYSAKNRIRNLLFFISVFSFLLYSNTIPNGYNLDDELVTINHRLTSQGIKAIPEIFTSPYYKDAAGNQYEYRPVTLTTFALEHQVFGDNAHVSHFINALIYAFLSIVLFLTLTQLFTGYNYLLPLTITLLFIAHPLHTEAVAGIKNRDELLSLLGGIAALYWAMKFAENRKPKEYLLFIFFFVLGVLSKKSIIPFALVIPLTLVFFNKARFVNTVLLSLPLALVTGVLWPFSIVWQKVVFTIILFVAPVIVYSILNTKEFISAITILKNKVINPETTEEKKGWQKILESRSINNRFIFSFILPLTIILTTVFVYYDLKIAGLIYTVILSLIFLHSKKQSENLLLLIISILIGAFAFFYGLKYMVWYVMFVLVSSYFKGEKKLNVQLLIAFILVFPVLLLGHKSISPISILPGPVLLALLSYFYFVKEKRLIISVSLVALSLASIFIISKFKVDFILLSGIGLILTLIHFSKNKIISDPIKMLVIFIPLAFYLNFNKVFWYKSPSVSGISVKEYYNNKLQSVSEKALTNNIVSSSGRELNFIEMPVKNSDPISLRLGTSFSVLGKYFQLLILPHPLGFYYGYAQVEPVPWNNFKSLISIGIYLILLGSAIYFFRKHPVYSYGVFFYITCISVFSNLAAPVAGMMGDRLAFTASAGFCISLGYLLLILSKTDIHTNDLRLNFSNKKYWIIGVLFFLYSAKTFSRNFSWKDHVTLMGSDIKHLEKSVQANNLLAVHLVKKSFKAKSQQEKEKNLNDAVKHFKKAVELYPKADFAWYDLGRTYLMLNNISDALPAFLKACEIDSTYLDSWMKAGAILIEQKKYPQAIHCLEIVIRNDSSNLQAYTSLSEVYFIQKNFEKAIEINLTAIENLPATYDPVVNIGKTYFTMGDKANALIYFEKAYVINPKDKNLVLTIANIYKEFGEQEKADFYFSKANQIFQ